MPVVDKENASDVDFNIMQGKALKKATKGLSLRQPSVVKKTTTPLHIVPIPSKKTHDQVQIPPRPPASDHEKKETATAIGESEQPRASAVVTPTSQEQQEVSPEAEEQETTTTDWKQAQRELDSLFKQQSKNKLATIPSQPRSHRAFQTHTLKNFPCVQRTKAHPCPRCNDAKVAERELKSVDAHLAMADDPEEVMSL